GAGRRRERRMRRIRATTLTLALGALALVPAPVSAGSAADPPAGAISSNVQFVSTIPEMRAAISINFIGNTMFVSTVHGLYSYDVSDPANPSLLGALPVPIWENEDMDVDPVR